MKILKFFKYLFFINIIIDNTCMTYHIITPYPFYSNFLRTINTLSLLSITGLYFTNTSLNLANTTLNDFNTALNAHNANIINIKDHIKDKSFIKEYKNAILSSIGFIGSFYLIYKFYKYYKSKKNKNNN